MVSHSFVLQYKGVADGVVPSLSQRHSDQCQLHIDHNTHRSDLKVSDRYLIDVDLRPSPVITRDTFMPMFSIVLSKVLAQKFK